MDLPGTPRTSPSPPKCLPPSWPPSQALVRSHGSGNSQT
jgi:hypothetical protein